MAGAKRKSKSRVQVNGKAGSGKTINMSGLAKPDQQLRNIGIKPKLKVKPKKKSKKK